MKVTENLQEFYQRLEIQPRESISHNTPHINVFERGDCKNLLPYSRRDYYKVTLVIGEGRVEYADKTIYIDKPALLFSNPTLPYYWQSISDLQQGWFCIFNEAFIHQRDNLLTELPMFQMNTEKVYFIDEKSVGEILDLFQKMKCESLGNYAYKQDIMRNYLHLIVHYALKSFNQSQQEVPVNANARITQQFFDVLESQFPIDSMQNQLQLTTAKDFADTLNLHVNHLNRAVKTITGKTTTEHIAHRIVLEANQLLTYTDWAIAEIAYCLGFQYPAYFNNFYRKATGNKPKELRKLELV